MSQPKYNPENTPQSYAWLLSKESAPLITPEFTETAQRVAESMVAFAESGGQTTSPEAIVQKEAYDKTEEAQRDEFVHRLGQITNRNIDDELNNGERTWRSTPEGELGYIWIESWMKDSLDMDGTNDPSFALGVMRQTPLNRVDNKTFWLQELEIQNSLIEQSGEARDRHNRIIWLYETTA